MSIESHIHKFSFWVENYAFFCLCVCVFWSVRFDLWEALSNLSYRYTISNFLRVLINTNCRLPFNIFWLLECLVDLNQCVCARTKLPTRIMIGKEFTVSTHTHTFISEWNYLIRLDLYFWSINRITAKELFWYIWIFAIDLTAYHFKFCILITSCEMRWKKEPLTASILCVWWFIYHTH